MPLVLAPGKGLEVWQLELAETMGRHIGAALAAAERRDEHRRLGVLEERAAIARELHDSLAQSLSYTKIQLARLAASIEREGHSVQSVSVLMELREGINSAYRELRELAHDVPAGTRRRRLRRRIARYRGRVRTPIGRAGDAGQRPAEGRLAANEQVHVLQVVREALTNIEHHAHARHAWVSLKRGAGHGHRGDGRGRRRRDQERPVAARPLRPVDHARPRAVRRRTPRDRAPPAGRHPGSPGIQRADRLWHGCARRLHHTPPKVAQ